MGGRDIALFLYKRKVDNMKEKPNWKNVTIIILALAVAFLLVIVISVESLNNDLERENYRLTNQIEEMNAETEESEEVLIEESDVSSESSESTELTDDKQVNEERFDQVVVFAQFALQDMGIDDYQMGTSQWNVVHSNTRGTDMWIATCQDSEYGRIKYICEWSGDEDDLDHSDIYLLVSGEEYYNAL